LRTYFSRYLLSVGMPFELWMRRIAEEGFVGIKLHPMYQDFIADEPRLDPIYAEAADGNLAVTIHCGQDIAYPDAGDRASPARMRNVIERHKNLKLICTHMGGWRDWQDSRKHLAGAACLMETSFSMEELGPPAAIEFIRAHGAGQVMFGTDWPWQDQKKAMATLKGVGLSEDELRQVMWSNAARLLGY
jgi:predicted TIM-barrel fold metal-dependent hydrolase